MERAEPVRKFGGLTWLEGPGPGPRRFANDHTIAGCRQNRSVRQIVSSAASLKPRKRCFAFRVER